MRPGRARPHGESGSLRTSVRRVALGTTFLALAAYVLAAFVADAIVASRFEGATDARLTEELAGIAASSPRGRPRAVLGTYVSASGDLDDPPVVVWWLPRRTGRVVPLMAGAPTLPRGALADAGPTDMTLAGRPFRLAAVALDGGTLVAGTSEQDDRRDLSTLELIEAILAPVVLLTLYGAAWLIGRRAALPVERARRRQLDFTSDASHELRTPLSVIEAEVGLALHGERTPGGYRVSLERIAEESKRLRDIVEDLLWLARLDSLPDAPPVEAVDLSVLAEVCASRFAAVAARRGISISMPEEPEEPRIVEAPSAWIDRLASVLIDNACRYSNDGGRIEVAVRCANGRVELSVDDDGPGIAEEDRENIFRRFHRLSPLPGGAGLGMSIASAVVDATGGTWTIGSSRLGGAHVAVSWPSGPIWAEEPR